MISKLQSRNLKAARDHLEIQNVIHELNHSGIHTVELPEQAFPAWYALGYATERDFESHVILYYDKGLKVLPR